MLVGVAGAAEGRRVGHGRLRYGLGASIWSTDIARARRLAERLEVRNREHQQPRLHRRGPRAPLERHPRHRLRRGEQAQSLATLVARGPRVDSAPGSRAVWMPYDEALWETARSSPRRSSGRSATPGACLSSSGATCNARAFFRLSRADSARQLSRAPILPAARVAIARMVICGFTPSGPGTVLPSTTRSPGTS